MFLKSSIKRSLTSAFEMDSGSTTFIKTPSVLGCNNWKSVSLNNPLFAKKLLVLK